MRFSRTSEMRRRRRRKVKVKARGGERIGEKEKESKRATLRKKGSQLRAQNFTFLSVLWSAKFSHTQTNSFQ